MTRIALVRHAAVSNNTLTKESVESLQKLAQKLSPEFKTVAQIFCSPTERTTLTGQFLAEILSLPSPMPEDELRENAGNFSALKIITAESKNPLIFVTHAPTSRLLMTWFLGNDTKTVPLSLGGAVIIDTDKKTFDPLSI